jgi:hypothetical protein
MALDKSDSRRGFCGLVMDLGYEDSRRSGREGSAVGWSSGGSSASSTISSPSVEVVGALERLNIFRKFWMAEPLLAASCCCF